MEDVVILQLSRRVAVIIVGFCNGGDVARCLAALSGSSTEPSFDVFICENGGKHSFQRLTDELAAFVATPLLDEQFPSLPNRFVDIKTLALKHSSAKIYVACASHNLGYAGGVNAWIEKLLEFPGWEGIWILNPDTAPDPTALSELVRRAHTAGKGMVGSTIVPLNCQRRVSCRGGLRWRKFMTRPALIGYLEPIDASHNVEAIESIMDCVSGASMYVTRQCIGEVGLMEERFFLYYEDLDWGMRAKRCGLGYASASVVPHCYSTTIGSSPRHADRSWLSVYLENRNRIHFIRIYFPRSLVWATILSVVYAMEYLVAWSPRNFRVAIQGLVAGLRGEIGPPANLAIDTRRRFANGDYRIEKRS
jgi:N-acetylglucosaminyl-diphospho-decaprenol L-rhamnosyltransferase